MVFAGVYPIVTEVREPPHIPREASAERCFFDLYPQRALRPGLRISMRISRAATHGDSSGTIG